ncbi:hypothetical protein Ahy_A01g001654 [Arachis hypogaea]|uniref:Uncharacterized protein n=1 Tax=Arachis hypogaea TaxID=3818 RepID=A0A445EP91_ARAHY|nr:hypothetical protein Ahy_A01g001654 [Arachis hypogaea]
MNSRIRHEALERIVGKSDRNCIWELRMNTNIFANLCELLQVQGGLIEDGHLFVCFRDRTSGQLSLGRRMNSRIRHEALERIVGKSDRNCIWELRMNTNIFANLCELLQVQGGLIEDGHLFVCFRDRTSGQLSLGRRMNSRIRHEALERIVGKSYRNCIWELRMNTNIFANLCELLQVQGGLIEDGHLFVCFRDRTSGQLSLGRRMNSRIRHEALERIVGKSDRNCIWELRMNTNIFANLCELLQVQGGLIEDGHVSLPKQLRLS